MLQFPKGNPDTAKKPTRVNQEKTHVGCTSTTDDKITLLATALCVVADTNGTKVVLRALIDQGTTCSFITDKAARLLKLNRKPTKITIQGIGNSHMDAREEVNLSIRPHFKSNFQLETTAVVLKTITGQVPQRQILVRKQQKWPQPLADPTFDQPGIIDILLSAKDIPSLMMNNAIIIKGEPLMQQTYLGYEL